MRFYKIIIEKELNVRLIEAPVWCPIGRWLRRCWIVHFVTSAREWKCGRIHYTGFGGWDGCAAALSAILFVVFLMVWTSVFPCDLKRVSLTPPFAVCFYQLTLLTSADPWASFLISGGTFIHIHMYLIVVFVWCIIQMLIIEVSLGLNNKDGLLALGQCDSFRLVDNTDNHLSFQASAALPLKIICWSCTSIFMAQNVKFS